MANRVGASRVKLTETKYTNLFGEEVAKPEEPKDKPKAKNAPKGYAKPPGSGPDNESCGSCEHATCRASFSKNHWKCALLKAYWTKGLGTDIRLKSPACSLWQAKQQETKS